MNSNIYDEKKKFKQMFCFVWNGCCIKQTREMNIKSVYKRKEAVFRQDFKFYNKKKYMKLKI